MLKPPTKTSATGDQPRIANSPPRVSAPPTSLTQVAPEKHTIDGPREESQQARKGQGSSTSETANPNREAIDKSFANVSEVFKAPHIPENKLRNAIKTYAAKVGEHEVVLLHDDSFFGSAKNGFLLTENCMFWRNGGYGQSVGYKDVISVVLDELPTPVLTLNGKYCAVIRRSARTRRAASSCRAYARIPILFNLGAATQNQFPSAVLVVVLS